jgi:hypothetical protein
MYGWRHGPWPPLRRAVEEDFATTTFTTPPHPRRPGGWLVAWGEQVDLRTVRDPDLTRDPTVLTEEQVAGYLAKYATKATEVTGHSSARLTPAGSLRSSPVATISPTSSTPAGPSGIPPPTPTPTSGRGSGRRNACGMRGYAAGARMLGFGGHFSTKSRRYSSTLGAPAALVSTGATPIVEAATQSSPRANHSPGRRAGLRRHRLAFDRRRPAGGNRRRQGPRTRPRRPRARGWVRPSRRSNRRLRSEGDQCHAPQVHPRQRSRRQP